jgi:uncharacterized protein (TIGR02145 family)
MKKIFCLVLALLMISPLLAQNKTLTVYYGNDSTKVINIANSDSVVIFICGASRVSYGGKDYNTVLIGSQCWLKENLDVGTMINGSNQQTNNGIIEKYCYNNVPNNCSTYGGLYQWNEAMQYFTTPGAKGVCPAGWHIPTLLEFQTLDAAVGNNGNSLKAIGQGTGGGAGTNGSGFTALLSGYLFSGSFNGMGFYTYIRSSSENNSTNAFVMYLDDTSSSLVLFANMKEFGFPVRCLKN